MCDRIIKPSQKWPNHTNYCDTYKYKDSYKRFTFIAFFYLKWR